VKLEKRLDDSLLYLRDALPEYSTFDVNMKPVVQEPNQKVPVNEPGAIKYKTTGPRDS
ncbi:MRPL19 isoform 6, partial [Pan troglodytes]